MHEKEKEIFDAAIEISDAAKRAQYLESACGDDQALRQRVDALLDAAEDFGSFMQKQAADSVEITAEIELPAEVGQTIGCYKLLQEIGEGGFGVVYMAEQQYPLRRKVALKIIKPGMDSKQVIGRFEAERQALAMLDHPNIARVIDAGATQSLRPFFVMELVRGEPITECCDANRLDTTQRLKLFLDVCHAIQHSHQKGIIHRDIKPSNVLVTIIDDQPVAKVIDFGIAKATEQRLTERTLFTEFKQFMGTPAYMSPEQASLSGTDIDTRSDIYSLGVLLYELLAGQPPFDDKALRAAGYEELCRIIRETVPPSPSSRISSLGKSTPQVVKNRNSDVHTLQSTLRGEVDWIVMKALEKDRARRYESAGAFATDICRYLNQEPVSAGPPSTIYQLRKLFQRHRNVAISGIAILTSLVIGAVAATVGMYRANQQATRAVRAESEASDRAEQLAMSGERLRRNLYVIELAAAQRAFEQKNLLRTRKLLGEYLPDQQQTDLRGFEWRWLWNQCHRELFTFGGGPSYDPDAGPGIRAMRFSSDGRWLATGATDGFVRLWDVSTRKQIWSYRGGEDCNIVDISPDGRLLLTGYYEPVTNPGFTVWDISNPHAPVEFTRLAKGGVQFLPDSNSFVASDGAEYDLSGNQLREPYIFTPGPNGQLWTRHYSQDRKTLATANRIWDVPSGKLLKQLPLHDGYFDVGPVGVAISPLDSNLIATGCPTGVRLWDREGNQVGEIPDTGGTAIGWLSFSARGDMLAVREFAGAIRVFNTDDWTEIDAFPVPYPDNSVIFSPVDNNLLVAGGSDGSLRAYSVSAIDRLDVSFEHTSEILALNFSPNGRLLAAGAANGSVLIWDVAARKQIFMTPKRVDVTPGRLRHHSSLGPDFLAFSPDSQYLAIEAKETVTVWNIDDQEIVAEWTFPVSQTTHPGGRRDYWGVCFSKDGRQLFAANHSNSQIDVWDWPDLSGDFRPRATLPGRFKCLDSSPEGLLASVEFKSLNLWALPEGRLVRDSAPKVQVTDGENEFFAFNLAFSPDGQQLAVSSVNVDVIDVENWHLVKRLPHSTPIEHVNWSPDGSRIVASDLNANTHLWDVSTAKTLATFRGAISAFSPDGSILAVGAQGSKYIGDTKHLNRVTLYYAPSLDSIDEKIRESRSQGARD